MPLLMKRFIFFVYLPVPMTCNQLQQLWINHVTIKSAVYKYKYNSIEYTISWTISTWGGSELFLCDFNNSN